MGLDGGTDYCIEKFFEPVKHKNPQNGDFKKSQLLYTPAVRCWRALGYYCFQALNHHLHLSNRGLQNWGIRVHPIRYFFPKGSQS